MKGQTGFINGIFIADSNSPSLSCKEKILRVEILEVLAMVDKTKVFHLAMVTETSTEKCYLIQILLKIIPNKRPKLSIHWNTPYIKDLVKKDISNKPFSFKFETNSNMKLMWHTFQIQVWLLKLHFVVHYLLVIVHWIKYSCRNTRKCWNLKTGFGQCDSLFMEAKLQYIYYYITRIL